MAQSDNDIIERYDPEYHEAQIIAAEHLARYRWATQFASGAAVLDIACGAGYGCAMLAEAGARSVVGVDIDEATVEHARARVPAGVTLTAGDIRGLTFEDGTFDLVVCLETIEHVEEPERALDELRRVMTAGGVLVISSPNRGVLPDVNPFHLHEYTAEELEASLLRRFETVRLRRQRTWVGSGVLDDEAFANSGGAPIAGVDLRKVAADTPGQELYTVAVASDGEIPEDGGVITLTSNVELSEWHRLWHEQHRILEDQKNVLEQQAEVLGRQAEVLGQQKTQLRAQAAHIDASDDERDHLRTALVAAERDISRMAQLQSDFDELINALREEGRQHELADQATHRAMEEVERLRAELDSVWGGYADVVNSRSWKLTAPVRITGKLLRRLR